MEVTSASSALPVRFKSLSNRAQMEVACKLQKKVKLGWEFVFVQRTTVNERVLCSAWVRLSRLQERLPVPDLCVPVYIQGHRCTVYMCLCIQVCEWKHAREDCIHVHVCLCVHTCVCVDACACVHCIARPCTWMWTCMCAQLTAHMNSHAHEHIGMYDVYPCVCVHTCVYMDKCVYMCIHTWTHMHTGVLVTHPCLIVCDPMECSLPGSSVHGILQARILDRVAIPSPGDLPDLEIKPGCPALQADSLPSEHPGKPVHKACVCTLT